MIARHAGTTATAVLHDTFNPSLTYVCGFCSAGRVAAGAAAGGGVSPTMRYTSVFPQEYEIGTTPATMIASGTQVQKPIVLCQLKSRAFAGTTAEPEHVAELNPVPGAWEPQIEAADDQEQNRDWRRR